MIEFLRRFFVPERSSETAKERLKLVLLSDHLSLAPDVVAALKRDLLEVISRYVEIDPAHADVTFEQRDREVAMLASIPITGMRERAVAAVAERSNATAATANEPVVAVAPEPEAEHVVPARVAQPVVVPSASAAHVDEPDVELEPEPEPPLRPQTSEEPAAAPVLRRTVSPDASANANPAAAGAAPAPRRRKRRRKTAGLPRNAPAPAHGTPGFDLG